MGTWSVVGKGKEEEAIISEDLMSYYLCKSLAYGESTVNDSFHHHYW